MRYNYTNNLRNVILDIIESEFTQEISDNKVVINEIADIPIDATDDKLVFYVRKLRASYSDEYYRDADYQKGTFSIGVRSCSEEKELNVKVAEDYIYRLWKLLRTNDYSFCGYATEVTSEHSLVAKDRNTRYFWEFDLEVSNR